MGKSTSLAVLLSLAACDSAPARLISSPAARKRCVTDSDLLGLEFLFRLWRLLQHRPHRRPRLRLRGRVQGAGKPGLRCTRGQCERRDKPAAVTLDHVNATPCTRDADCGIAPRRARAVVATLP